MERRPEEYPETVGPNYRPRNSNKVILRLSAETILEAQRLGQEQGIAPIDALRDVLQGDLEDDALSEMLFQDYLNTPENRTMFDPDSNQN